MPGLSQAESQATLDARFPTTGGTDYIMHSANGTSETALVPRTAIGATGWAAATAADPSVKANASTVTIGAATGAVTVSHYAIISAATGGTQRTDWQAIEDPNSAGTPLTRSLVAGDQLVYAAGKIKITLT